MSRYLAALILLTASLSGCNISPDKPLADEELLPLQSCLPESELQDLRELKWEIESERNIFASAPIVQSGRYTSLKAIPTQEQIRLLDVIIKVKIPDHIHTISASIRYLLKRSGYQLTGEDSQGDKVAEILSRQLPEVHRNIGPMTLMAALNMLTTPAFILIEDPVRREVHYRLKQQYQTGDL